MINLWAMNEMIAARLRELYLDCVMRLRGHESAYGGSFVRHLASNDEVDPYKHDLQCLGQARLCCLQYFGLWILSSATLPPRALSLFIVHAGMLFLHTNP